MSGVGQSCEPRFVTPRCLIGRGIPSFLFTTVLILNASRHERTSRRGEIISEPRAVCLYENNCKNFSGSGVVTGTRS